jgi:hypothetical protein
MNHFAILHNGQAIPRSQIEHSSFENFRRTIVEGVAGGQRVAAFFGDVSNSSAQVELYAILADSDRGCLRVGKTTLDSDQFPSLTPDCPPVHLFEREIAEQYGVRPEGHPWFKPVRFHASYRPGHDVFDPNPIIGGMDYYRVEGEEIHEVAVCSARNAWRRVPKERSATARNIGLPYANAKTLSTTAAR